MKKLKKAKEKFDRIYRYYYKNQFTDKIYEVLYRNNLLGKICHLLPEISLKGKKFFCQNSGSCGSMYIVELLKVNGFARCFHEKSPDLDVLGIDFYEEKIPPSKIKKILRLTRANVYFEANNRLFSMTKELAQVFPDARFIHLHRDPRQGLASARSKPYDLTFGSGRRRYTSKKLCGPPQRSLLERMCNYWVNYNEKILSDLEGLDFISLKFSDLIKGNLKGLENFMEIDLEIKKIPPVNHNKPVRKEGRFPSFEEWPEEEKELFWKICKSTMKKLGYI